MAGVPVSNVVPRLLKQVGVGLEQIELIEIHEAFAAQVLANAMAWEQGWKAALPEQWQAQFSWNDELLIQSIWIRDRSTALEGYHARCCADCNGSIEIITARVHHYVLASLRE